MYIENVSAQIRPVNLQDLETLMKEGSKKFMNRWSKRRTKQETYTIEPVWITPRNKNKL